MSQQEIAERQVDTQVSEELKRAQLWARVRGDLGYHKPPDETAALTCRLLRQQALLYAEFLIKTCPPGRDLSRALTHVEDASRAAVAAVAKTWPLADD